MNDNQGNNNLFVNNGVQNVNGNEVDTNNMVGKFVANPMVNQPQPEVVERDVFLSNVVSNVNENIDSSGEVNDNPFGFTINPNITYDTPEVVSEDKKEEKKVVDGVSVGKYLGNMILFAIPLIGFIILLVKVFSKKDVNISNFAKALLLFSFIMVILLSGGVMLFAYFYGDKFNAIIEVFKSFV